MTKYDGISVTEYDGGVLAIDAGFVREHMAACYMVEGSCFY